MSDEVTTPAVDSVLESPPVAAVAVEVAAAPANLLDAISEDLRGQSNLKDFKDINSLAKSYIELDRMRGSSIRIPSKDASPEAKAEFLNKLKDIDGVILKSDEKLMEKLGKPLSKDEYKLDIPEEVIKGNPNLSQDLETFRTVAHEVGLTNDQAAKIVSNQLAAIKAVNTATAAKKEASIQTLKTAWGNDFDNRLAGVKQVAKILTEKHGDSMKELINSPAGSNPALLQILADMAVTFKENNHAGLSTTHFGTTPEMAKQKIAEKRADIGFVKAHQDRQHPGHAKAVQELDHLYKLANGEI